MWKPGTDVGNFFHSANPHHLRYSFALKVMFPLDQYIRRPPPQTRRQTLDHERKSKLKPPISPQLRPSADPMAERRDRHLLKDELAAMAEALVNLTKFKRRVSTARETVGGPIDVAVITKGDGFVWVKRKHYFSPDLNPRVIARYQHGG